MYPSLYPAADMQFAVEDLQEDSASITATLRPRECSAQCPRCHHQSVRVQSRYLRRITDLPINGKVVHLHVHVRRFHCQNATCPQHIFSERFEGFAVFSVGVHHFVGMPQPLHPDHRLFSFMV